jgi:D-glycero-D-manno-heptose 1,7-bisphosphate phosphatase
MENIENVILDRDGTVIVDKHYLHDPAGVELLPGAGEGLALLARAGIRLFIATNQSGIGRGYFPEADYHAVDARLRDMLADYGVSIVDTAFCPHAPDTPCNCRKPATGMWSRLAADHGLAPANTVMIGDKDADVRFGLEAGLAASILVLTGKGAGELDKYALGAPLSIWTRPSPRPAGAPHVVARDLGAACDFILHHNATIGESVT